MEHRQLTMVFPATHLYFFLGRQGIFMIPQAITCRLRQVRGPQCGPSDHGGCREMGGGHTLQPSSTMAIQWKIVLRCFKTINNMRMMGRMGVSSGNPSIYGYCWGK